MTGAFEKMPEVFRPQPVNSASCSHVMEYDMYCLAPPHRVAGLLIAVTLTTFGGLSSAFSQQAIGPPATIDAATDVDPETAEEPTQKSGDSAVIPELRPIDKAHLAILKKPLTEISLTQAMRAETTRPDEDGAPIPLGVPRDTASGVYGQLPSILDASPPPVVRHPNRNLHPICHNPLYFEDPNLERCGRGHGVCTEAVSAFRFAGKTALVPYMMGSQPPCSCVRALPDCPSCQKFNCDVCVPELNLKGIAAQEFAVLGLIFLIP